MVDCVLVWKLNADTIILYQTINQLFLFELWPFDLGLCNYLLYYYLKNLQIMASLNMGYCWDFLLLYVKFKEEANCQAQAFNLIFHFIEFVQVLGYLYTLKVLIPFLSILIIQKKILLTFLSITYKFPVFFLHPYNLWAYRANLKSIFSA